MHEIGKEEVGTRRGCGVRQGDNLAPTLFVIAMQLVAEDALLQLKRANADVPQVRCSEDGNGMLKLREKDEIENMELKESSILTRADDGAMIFNTREETAKASEISCEEMAK